MAYLIDVKIEYLENLLNEFRKNLKSAESSIEKCSWWDFNLKNGLKEERDFLRGQINGINVSIDVLKDKSITNNPHGERSTISRRTSEHSKGNR